MATTSEETKRVLLVVVDDHEFAREAVAASLSVEPDFEIVGVAGTVADAKAVIERRTPDIAIVDLNLPDGSGSELVTHFSSTKPALRTVVYTSTLSEGQEDQLRRDGASAVVLKTLRGTELVDTIRRLS